MPIQVFGTLYGIKSGSLTADSFVVDLNYLTRQVALSAYIYDIQCFSFD